MRMHVVDKCWCGCTHKPHNLLRINGQEEATPRPALVITADDPGTMAPDSSQHEIRFTTVFDAHSAMSNVVHLTDAELASLVEVAHTRLQAIR